MIIELSIRVEISYWNFSRSNQILLRYRVNSTPSKSGILTWYPFDRDIKIVLEKNYSLS